ncbi:hypothetical protein [Marinomonas mediterranea]|jgi:hypothetical protein|uniref:Uncharacterized protein n=1 Tax=Marinomonas mediterranea (strain ATCC 700492 / JCM 21426 / NBRC 103028 / MMB-1) TaxID=717774 RepID=F2JXC1_MARM1|nr:hypothetical protein [Marinomonas mediterranea]ADZ90727.1 hypothetical protein Marme_1460 [Marinomonas mediterranea MMB-1]WCN16886.1 hypothetical protein GV053_07345 [Marinomonas mediterranea MMB-1]
MKYLLIVSLLLPFCVQAQRVEQKPVDIIYGDHVYRGTHQVVTSSPLEVEVIPAEKPKLELGPNVIVSSGSTSRSYIEEVQLAKKEQEIYDEVNRRTREAPFTVLFTGNIPEEIQEKRLSMMPEVGIFGDQLQKLQEDQQALNPQPDETESLAPDVGEFSEVTPGNRVIGTKPATSNQAADESPQDRAEMSDEEKLEQLIGG